MDAERRLGPTADAPTANAMRRALRRARDGVALDVGEAAVLLRARGEDLLDLCASAARVRDAGLAEAGRPGVITYSKKVFIPLTRLCRDRCHYCTFVTVPGKLRKEGHGLYLSPDEVLEIARQGAALGCKEALFTLGDRPEDRWPEAREWLDAHGYDDTLAYVRAMSIRVLEETGLLPHLNPGVLSWTDFQRLKPVSPSMGMMLETTATRLWSEPGGPHHGSPDKEPAVRLRVLEDAGRSAVPFTTGILIGIGETYEERADSLFAIRRIARQYHGIQEVIVQNFRAKPDTAMRAMPDAELAELAAAVAVARVVLGPSARIQAPPNLVDDEYRLIIDAGIDDWGGVSPLTPDHVNPERPWPQIEDLAARTGGGRLRAARAADRLPRVPAARRALARPAPAAARQRAGRPGDRAGRPRRAAPRPAVAGARGPARRLRPHRPAPHHRHRGPHRRPPGRLRRRLRRLGGAARAGRRDGPRAAVRRRPRGAGGRRRRPGEAHRRPGTGPVPRRRPGPGRAVRASPTRCAATRSATTVTYFVTRNINFTNVCYTGCRFCAFAQRRTDADAYTLSLAQVADRAAQAWDVGATEVCMQGGIHPDLPGTAYFDIARAVKERVPGMHVHAFSPMEVVNGATRTGLSIRDWLAQAQEAGLDTIPGTAAEILDDEVRWVLTKGKLPAATWVEVVTAAHELGIRSSSTMMYGHVDTPAHWLGHLRLLAEIQQRTGGFTEFVTLPFIHTNAPVYLAGISRPGPTHRDNRAVVAMARLLLHTHIPNIQTSWVKLGAQGAAEMLRSGANDLGGTLMEETISRMAGSAYGSYQSIRDLEAIAEAAGRPSRQRTTTYGEVPAERRAAALASDGHLPELLPVLD